MSDQDEIARFLAERGVTKCPDAYAAAVAGAAPLSNARPEQKRRWIPYGVYAKRRSQKWAWTGKPE